MSFLDSGFCPDGQPRNDMLLCQFFDWLKIIAHQEGGKTCCQSQVVIGGAQQTLA